MRRARPGRGAALILVLWLVAAMSLVVLAGTRSVRQSTQRAAWEMERMRAEALLDSALQLAAQKLLQTRVTEYTGLDVQLGGNTVTIEVVPASGLVDVHVVSDVLLQTLLQNAGGLSASDAAILTARIRDFIDPDDIPQGNGGAEAAQYRAAGLAHVPRNARLDDLIELRSVLGMTPDVYAKILPFLSINGQQRIDIGSAPPALIDVLSGQQGLGTMVRSSPPEMRAGLLSGSAEHLPASTGAGSQTIVRLTASARFAQGGALWRREAWVDLRQLPGAPAPWTILALEPVRRVNQSSGQETNP
ncbi:MAG: general secretion pathway protein GspK [Burkholderiaceae bacterium]|jgi:general secretion pathway protein K|nr:general secretion pathway protein GspK [Burkholderiaceae bacterium]